jgi:hypothetical protein
VAQIDSLDLLSAVRAKFAVILDDATNGRLHKISVTARLRTPTS